MMQAIYPVFEIDGVEYVADIRAVLTSNPPQYNAYRLSDKKHFFVPTSQALNPKRGMTAADFYDFVYGKSSALTADAIDLVAGTNIGKVALTTSLPVSISAEYIKPNAIDLPPTLEERFEALVKRVEALEKLR